MRIKSAVDFSLGAKFILVPEGGLLYVDDWRIFEYMPGIHKNTSILCGNRIDTSRRNQSEKWLSVLFY